MQTTCNRPSVEVVIQVGSAGPQVSALLLEDAASHALLVLGHGAGAGMHHPFMEQLAVQLAACGIATLRYQFPYMERGRRSPDSRRKLLDTVRAALARARELRPSLPLYAGGKSMGGRMASLALAQQPDTGVRGVIFFGFPLHNAGQRGNDRADHLLEVAQPMLFLQGTRDKLADLEYLRPVCERLGARATLHVVEGGDHSFAMLKRSGREQSDAIAELARTASEWINARAGADR